MIELERNALVWGVVGNLGGGKSLSAVSVGVRAMISGYFVASNITFNMDLLAEEQGEWIRRMYMHLDLDADDFDPFKIPQGDPRGSGGKRRVIVILDEVAEWVDQYSNAKDPKIKRLWSWLRHSSKRSQDIFIICQRQQYINKVIRILIARWIWVDDLAVWRMPFLKMKIPFAGGWVMQNVFDRNGAKIGQVSFALKKAWGKYYNTAECLNKDGAGYEYVYEKAPPLRHDYTILYFLWIASIIYVAYCGTGRQRHGRAARARAVLVAP